MFCSAVQYCAEAPVSLSTSPDYYKLRMSSKEPLLSTCAEDMGFLVMGLFFYIALVKWSCYILDYRWTKCYYFDPPMIGYLCFEAQTAANSSFSLKTIHQ